MDEELFLNNSNFEFPIPLVIMDDPTRPDDPMQLTLDSSSIDTLNDTRGKNILLSTPTADLEDDLDSILYTEGFFYQVGSPDLSAFPQVYDFYQDSLATTGYASAAFSIVAGARPTNTVLYQGPVGNLTIDGDTAGGAIEVQNAHRRRHDGQPRQRVGAGGRNHRAAPDKSRADAANLHHETGEHPGTGDNRQSRSDEPRACERQRTAATARRAT